MVEDLNDLLNAQGSDEDPLEKPAQALPPQPPSSRREMRRKRRRQKQNKVIARMVVIAALAFVAVGLFLGYKVITHLGSSHKIDAVSSVQDYPGPGTGSVRFTVRSGQGVLQIGDNLVKAQVVKSQAVFASTVSANNSTLYPGTFSLKRHMASADVVKILSDQSKATGFIEIRSGDRVSDVIAQAVKVSKISQDDFNAVINSGGAGILSAEAKGKFEGWLEPGTYDVDSKQSAGDLLKRMVDRRVSVLNSQQVPQGVERERYLILASVAESEVNSKEYYGKVVRVILNRLRRDMNLGMDSTVAYGLGIKADKLTDAMLADASNPYNTRVNPGLPPTPISNPGDNAIKAALSPDEGSWLYFVTTNLKTGETKFVNTEEEFTKIRQEYKNNNDNAN